MRLVEEGLTFAIRLRSWRTERQATMDGRERSGLAKTTAKSGKMGGAGKSAVRRKRRERKEIRQIGVRRPKVPSDVSPIAVRR